MRYSCTILHVRRICPAIIYSKGKYIYKKDTYHRNKHYVLLRYACDELLLLQASFSQVLRAHLLKHLDEFVNFLFSFDLVLPRTNVHTAVLHFVLADDEL